MLLTGILLPLALIFTVLSAYAVRTAPYTMEDLER